MAERIAVVDLARELRIRSAAILAYSRKEGIGLRSAAQPVSEAQAQKIRVAYKEDRIEPPDEHGRYGRRPIVHDDSGGPARPTGRCSCCELPYAYDQDNDSGRCADCSDHYHTDGEDDARKITRLTDHVDQMHRAVHRAGQSAFEHRADRDKAYRSRDVWKRVLIEVAVAHLPAEDGKACVCGAGTYPCATRRQISDLNPGIAKEVERLEGLPEDEFQEVLYGDLKHLRDWNPY